MTVGELRQPLRGLDDDWLVVLCKEAHDNGFLPLQEIGECQYIPVTRWSGDIKTKDPNDPHQDLEQWDPATNAVNAIILWTFA